MTSYKWMAGSSTYMILCIKVKVKVAYLHEGGWGLIGSDLRDVIYELPLGQNSGTFLTITRNFTFVNMKALNM